MTERITRIDPDQLHPTRGCHHITVVEAGRTAYLAGQCPLDRSGTRVGPGGLDARIDQVVANSLADLAAVGALPGPVRTDRRPAGPSDSLLITLAQMVASGNCGAVHRGACVGCEAGEAPGDGIFAGRAVVGARPQMHQTGVAGGGGGLA
ncbi:hypothetical protein [Streptomyces sp. NPDC093149]|uniref:hypothetical protein n=1 Tax=Streptomyces sp. NPDC093149 TaxID=3366031 RepID=UPI0037FFA607